MENNQINHINNVVKNRKNIISKRLDCIHSYYQGDDETQSMLLCDLNNCVCDGCYQSEEM